jgi:hypothetical protein
MAINEKLFEQFPIESLQEPTDGYKVYQNRYWLTYNGNILRYIPTKAWQCNPNLQIVEVLIANNPLYEGCEIQFFPYLYLPGA